LAVKEFDVSLLAFCITSNHTHLLARAEKPEQISALMQKIEGEFAEYYNIRKRRSGAFWAGRYHCTMIDTGEYLWNCMRYIDLNMVRAGAVDHPREWRWCGFGEQAGLRQRYCMLDMPAVLAIYGECNAEQFRENYRAMIDQAIAAGPEREPMWTESIAVGSESFVRQIEEETKSRMELDVRPTNSGAWTIREAPSPYD